MTSIFHIAKLQAIIIGEAAVIVLDLFMHSNLYQHWTFGHRRLGKRRKNVINGERLLLITKVFRNWFKEEWQKKKKNENKRQFDGELSYELWLVSFYLQQLPDIQLSFNQQASSKKPSTNDNVTAQ
jgi:hypothetical protein